jgi:hypothetical protein
MAENVSVSRDLARKVANATADDAFDDDDLLVVYRETDRGKPDLRRIPPSAVGGAATLPADEDAGTDAQTVVAYTDEREQSVTRWGARPDGTDCTAIWREADTWCAANDCTLYIPAGDWTFSTTPSGTSAPYYTFKASWRGAGEKLTRLLITHSTSTVPFRIGTPAGLANFSRAQSRSQASPYNPVYAIDDVPPGQGWVKMTTIADLTTAIAAGLAVGDLVHVAGGKNVQDADGNIWYYDQLHRIQEMDTVEGKVYFEDAIDYYLTSQGWDGAGAGKNLATDFADATLYATGAYVWYGLLLYKASVGGTSNNAVITDDTGVTWVQVSAAVSTAEKADGADWRPVLQKANSDAVQGLLFSDFTVDWSATTGSTMWALGGAYGCKHERCTFAGGTVYPIEASRHNLWRDCKLIRGGLDGANAGRNPINNYNSRKNRFVDCILSGGNTGVVGVGNRVVKIEGHGEIILENCDVSHVAFTATHAYCSLVDRGDFVARGCSLRGFKEPFRFNIAKMAEEIRPYTADVKNSRVHAYSKGFRHSLDDVLPLSTFGTTNNYLIKEPYSSGTYIQADNFEFTPSRYAQIAWSFTPAVDQFQVAVAVPDATAALIGITDLNNCTMIFLGAELLWVTPTANTITVRAQALEITTGSGVRNLLSDVDTGSHRLTVNSTTPRSKKSKGDGTSHRLLQAGIERPQIIYSSGANAGGTLYVILHVLL